MVCSCDGAGRRVSAQRLFSPLGHCAAAVPSTVDRTAHMSRLPAALPPLLSLPLQLAAMASARSLLALLLVAAASTAAMGNGSVGRPHSAAQCSAATGHAEEAHEGVSLRHPVVRLRALRSPGAAAAEWRPRGQGQRATLNQGAQWATRTRTHTRAGLGCAGLAAPLIAPGVSRPVVRPLFARCTECQFARVGGVRCGGGILDVGRGPVARRPLRAGARRPAALPAAADAAAALGRRQMVMARRAKSVAPPPPRAHADTQAAIAAERAAECRPAAAPTDACPCWFVPRRLCACVLPSVEFARRSTRTCLAGLVPRTVCTSTWRRPVTAICLSRWP